MSWQWRILLKFFNFALLVGNYPDHKDMKGRIAIGYNKLGFTIFGEKRRWWNVLMVIK